MSEIKMEVETGFNIDKLKEMSKEMSSEDFVKALEHLDLSIQDEYDNRLSLLHSFLGRMQFYMNDNPNDVNDAVELISNYELNEVSELYDELSDNFYNKLIENGGELYEEMELVRKRDLFLYKLLLLDVQKLTMHLNGLIATINSNKGVDENSIEYWRGVNSGYRTLLKLKPFKQTKEDLLKNYPEIEPNTENKLEMEEPKIEMEAEVNIKDSEEYKELEKKHQMLLAEFDNYKKRTAKEKETLVKSANKKLITDLLETVDNFDNASNTQGGLSEGIELTYRNFIKTLEKYGTENVDVDGEKLDTERMHQISQISVEDSDKVGTVVTTFQKGYSLNGEIIRFPKVVIGK
jgi:molecular chaperone GrpE